jgi:hypothetical protein
LRSRLCFVDESKRPSASKSCTSRMVLFYTCCF